MSAELVVKAERLAAAAYAPYSNYLVGAVVRAADGREFGGVNVENAAYPLGVCAEKSAITAAPCGGCRQWLHEFRIAEVSYRADDGGVETTTPAALLPGAWDLPE